MSGQVERMLAIQAEHDADRIADEAGIGWCSMGRDAGCWQCSDDCECDCHASEPAANAALVGGDAEGLADAMWTDVKFPDGSLGFRSVNDEVARWVIASDWLAAHDAAVRAEVHKLYERDGYVDESGMPVHLPVHFNLEGNGPANDSEKGFYGCWCGTDCSWNLCFKKDRAEHRERIAGLIEAKYLGPDSGRQYDGRDAPDAAQREAYDEGLELAARIARAAEAGR